MFLIFGYKYFFAKIVAYKNVWCVHCKKPVLATRIRRLVVWHLFYIPLIPLGFETEWSCSECKNEPHDASSFFNGMSIFLFALMFELPLIFGKADAKWDISASVLWGIRICFAAAIMYGIYVMTKQLSPLKSKQPVDPLTNTECLVCGNAIDNKPNSVCCSCGAVREG